MNIKSKMPQKLNPRTIFSSRRNLLVAVLALALIGGAAAFVIQRQNQDQSPNKQYQLVVDIKQLRKAGDCQKGLDQLKSFKTKSVDLDKPVAQERVADVLSYRVDCHYQLGNYDEALNHAAELQMFYQENGWSDFQKQSIAAQIETIKTEQETRRQEKANQEKPPNNQESFDGPRL